VQEDDTRQPHPAPDRIQDRVRVGHRGPDRAGRHNPSDSRPAAAIPLGAREVDPFHPSLGSDGYGASFPLPSAILRESPKPVPTDAEENEGEGKVKRQKRNVAQGSVENDPTSPDQPQDPEPEVLPSRDGATHEAVNGRDRFIVSDP